MAEPDLLVAGAGGALAGALRAADLGCQVLVVEANEHFPRGNNTAMSTAMIPGAGSRYQRELGVIDSPERFLGDIQAKTGGHADPLVASSLAEISAELVEWLADRVGSPIVLPADVVYPGHSVRRMHTVPGRHGSTLLRGLYERCRDHPNIDFLVPAQLVDLSPKWTATVRDPHGHEETIPARAVLLGTNGYGANPSLVSRYLPEIANAVYHGSAYSRGDALRLGIELGARSGYLDAYQGHSGLSVHARTLITWATVMHGGFVIDSVGRRFGDESLGYSEYAARLAACSDALGWIVLDERIHEKCLEFTDYRDADAAGVIRAAPDVVALAESLEVDARVLGAEFAEVAAVARGVRTEDRFGRTFDTAPRPPLRAVRVAPALFHTQGGLAVDAQARVLGRENPIPGLYASGGAAVGISGHGASGYLAGNGLLPALGLAYRAAAAAAHDFPVGSGREVH